MIRPATPDDFPMMLEMGRAFAEEAGVIGRVGWDDDSVIDTLEVLMEHGILLVSERGMIGGMLFPHPFNRDCMVFSELFWRAEDGQGRALLKEAERIAKERGANVSAMIAMDGMERTQRLYGKLGYGYCEAQFMKVLG
jgi:GNAT superfamily N-acetyltransferase